MSYTLCLDFGNTRCKAALFSKGVFESEILIEEPIIASVSAILHQYRPAFSILSSVVSDMPELEEMLSSKTHFHKLSYQSKLPFTTPALKPETIGADRLAICAAAVELFPGQHNLIIVLGTCVTYNFITAEHEFLGGAISPGLEMRFKSLVQFTAKLPLEKPSRILPLIGYDTRTNIQTGIQMGLAFEIDGFISEYSNRYSNFNILLTGGAWRHLAPHIKSKIFADPFLIYKGLYAISESNR
jgi:type III pantothenate kinase